MPKKNGFYPSRLGKWTNRRCRLIYIWSTTKAQPNEASKQSWSSFLQNEAFDKNFKYRQRAEGFFLKKWYFKTFIIFQKPSLAEIFFQVKRIWPEGVAFTKKKFYTAQTRTRWRFSFNVMKTRLFKFDNPNLEKVVYYFIMFVLEMFF